MNSLLNIKSFVKFLARNKAYTAINLFGLSISLMFVILIALHTEQSLSVDNFQQDRERIYVLTSEYGPRTALPIAYRLQARFSEIEQVCPIVTDNMPDWHLSYEGKKLRTTIFGVDSSFFNFFSFRLIEGNRNQVLKDPYSAVISVSYARKMFGTEDPIGKTLRISDETSVIISGIMEDIRRSVVPYADMLIRAERIEEFNSSISMTEEGNAGAVTAFLKVFPGADLRTKVDEILSEFQANFWIYKMGFWKKVDIIPLKEMFFQSFEGSSLVHGDKRFTLVLMSIGILILVFAIFNYINLTVAQAGQRAKEMATHRLLGSSRRNLFLRLVAEATLLTFISLLVSLFLILLVLPFVNDLLQTNMKIDDLFSFFWIVILGGFTLLIGALSGLLPAFFISAAKPIDVVRGTFRRQTKMVFSKCFITFQNVITIGMVAAALVMYFQIKHLIEAPLGYNTHRILVAENIFENSSELTKAEEQLRRIPAIKSIGYTNGTPFGGTNNLSGTYENKSLSFQEMTLDSAAFRMLGLEIIRDNQVASANEGWYLSEKALRDMELPMDAAVFHLNGEAIPILGVVRDFRLWNITRENSPVKIQFRDRNKNARWTPWNVIVEVEGDLATTYREVRSVFEEVAKVDFQGDYLENQIADSFENQIRLIQIVAIFAGVAILISLLGLIAISAYFVRQRAQETAIRRVFGAAIREVLLRQIGTFLSYVGIAFVIAAPISWYVMNEWLSDYSYRIGLSPLFFVGAGLFCLSISFVAVFFQSWQAVHANPVESVKNN